MVEKVCGVCESSFLPKEKAYRAKYCSTKCKNKAARLRLDPQIKSVAAKRRYSRVKTDTSRYSAHLFNGRKSAQAVRNWLIEYKVSRGCIDCGYNRHFSALQLDHTGKKTIEISMARSSIGRLLEEIESGKCVVRCAVCHSVKTWADKNGLVYQPSMAYEVKS